MNNLPSVAILLSTYNGEKYLEEQLQSIFSQTYWSNCTLFVRDDGSKDGTLAILRKYETEGKLILTAGENIGFVKSFFWLIKNAPDCDYYSFADQDGIWEKEKIEHSIKKLIENKDANNQPLLYFSDYSIIDGRGNKLVKHYHSLKIKPTFFNAMTLNQASGFTMVFNKKLNEKLKLVTPIKGQYHDYWGYLIALGLGVVVHDEYASALYRRHTNNESEDFVHGFSLLKKALSKKFLDKIYENFRLVLPEFKYLFYTNLTKDKQKILTMFTNKTLISQLKKFFFTKKYRDSIIKDFYCRLLCLFKVF